MRLVFGLLFLLVLLAAPFEARTNSSGAPAGRTGSPAENGLTCNSSGCHFGSAVNSGGGSISVSGPATFASGETIDLSITVQQEGAQRIGFEVSVVDASDAPVGTLKIVDANNTRFASNNPNYITHNGAPFGMTSRTFDIQWEAPNTHPGTVTFYITGNAANGNGGATGDNIYSLQYPMTESGTAIATEALPSHFSVTDAYPNPVADQATIGVNLPRATGVSVRLIDVLGRTVSSNSYGSMTAGAHELPVSVSGLISGTYVALVMSDDGRIASRPLVVR